jgi:threonyl-tRNA synthetase
LFGSVERFFGILVEHYAGAFPVWLAPVQAALLTVTGRVNEYAASLAKRFEAAGLRVEVDGRNEKINLKIREAQLQKIPYMLVLGDKEVEAGTVSLRHRRQGDLGTKSVDEVIALIREQNDTRICVE